MMPSDRFDRRLPAILDDIAQPRTPDYFDDLLGQTARTRQRPAWTLLERWLPMVDCDAAAAFVRQVPWRPIAVLALILRSVAASLLVIGSQPHRPAPFGLARNGLGGICQRRRHLYRPRDRVHGDRQGPEDGDPDGPRDGTGRVPTNGRRQARTLVSCTSRDPTEPH